MMDSKWARLKVAIAGLLEVVKDLSDEEVAVSISETEPAIFFACAVEAVAAFVRRQRRVKPFDLEQMAFPFLDRDLSLRIPTKKGRVEVGVFRLRELVEADKLLLDRRLEAARKPKPSSLAGKIRRQIELMKPYAYANYRVTVEDILEARKRGIELPKRDKPKGPVGMSDAMRRFWEAKSPQERSAIVRARQRKTREAKAAKKAGKKK